MFDSNIHLTVENITGDEISSNPQTKHFTY